ncbi:RNA polymerase subunit sigma [Amycolatopsis keratiniphila subsp. nogabecina]|nr:RNA polymerase subunit sigma [Amycolatopsis keratiniphila subsp. nogabecina]
MLDAVRGGNVAAYGELYKLHVGAARNLARQLAQSMPERDDLVSEAFSKVLYTLLGGRGPDSAFRAYLFTALRHTAYDKTRKARKVELTEDVEMTVGPVQLSVPDSNRVMAGFEKDLAADAFNRLPERWQTVLWLTEIEGKTPAEVASRLGLTANGVSALAYRAREGLRQAYLQAHLAEPTLLSCHPTVRRLGAWTRNGLSKRETQQVREHLARCGSCCQQSVELSEINTAFRSRAVASTSHSRPAGAIRQSRSGQMPLSRQVSCSSTTAKLAS